MSESARITIGLGKNPKSIRHIQKLVITSHIDMRHIYMFSFIYVFIFTSAFNTKHVHMLTVVLGHIFFHDTAKEELRTCKILMFLMQNTKRSMKFIILNFAFKYKLISQKS